MVKVVFDAKTGNFLGAHMVGAEVTGIQGYVVAMNAEVTEHELMQTVFPHPTLSEMMPEAVLGATGACCTFEYGPPAYRRHAPKLPERRASRRDAGGP